MQASEYNSYEAKYAEGGHFFGTDDIYGGYIDGGELEKYIDENLSDEIIITSDEPVSFGGNFFTYDPNDVYGGNSDNDLLFGDLDNNIKSDDASSMKTDNIGNNFFDYDVNGGDSLFDDLMNPSVECIGMSAHGGASKSNKELKKENIKFINSLF